MIVERYDPVNLFEMVPKLKLEMEPELAQLDQLLEDDVLFARVKDDLARRYPNSARLGRRSTPVEVILRMLVVKRLYDWSYEQTEHFVSDSIVLRQFCRLYLESVPDDTTLIRWANQVGSQTVASLNDRVVELARSLKVTRGRKLRVDSMVVETNIHHPTDSALLADGVRVISRLLRGAKKVLPTEVASQLGKKEAFRTRNRSVRRVAQRLHRIARRKGEKAREELKEAYQKLIAITQASCAQAVRVVGALRGYADEESGARRLLEGFEHFVPLVEQGIAQATRRVLHDEQVPAQQKILSLFDGHTERVRTQGFNRRGGWRHHKPLRDFGGGGSRTSAPTRQPRGTPGALQKSATALGSRPRPLLGREREIGPPSGGKARRATQERASLARAGAA